MFHAVVFDFDGVVIDTETPLYAAWCHAFEHYGVEPIALEEWCRSLGLPDDHPELLDPFQRLRTLLGRDLDPEEVRAVRRGHREALFADLPLLPGVRELLDEADRLGVPVGLATSSQRDWIDEHLGPRGLLDRFGAISCAGPGVPGKPDPTVYRRACEALGVDPTRSLAIEDSPNGTTAARAAGLRCVAVRAGLSRTLDLDHADLVVDSLAGASLVDLHAVLEGDGPA